MWTEILQHFGSQAALAKAVGVTQPTVSERVRRGGPVPAEWAVSIEAASNGAISRQSMRPDLWPDSPARGAA